MLSALMLSVAYAECRLRWVWLILSVLNKSFILCVSILKVIIFSALIMDIIMLSVVIMNVIILSVAMLIVVAPKEKFFYLLKSCLKKTFDDSQRRKSSALKLSKADGYVRSHLQ
jgi:archaellum biogenesis protein FlaJ (TadC family)